MNIDLYNKILFNLMDILLIILILVLLFFGERDFLSVYFLALFSLIAFINIKINDILDYLDKIEELLYKKRGE